MCAIAETKNDDLFSFRVVRRKGHHVRSEEQKQASLLVPCSKSHYGILMESEKRVFRREGFFWSAMAGYVHSSDSVPRGVLERVFSQGNALRPLHSFLSAALPGSPALLYTGDDEAVYRHMIMGAVVGIPSGANPCVFFLSSFLFFRLCSAEFVGC